MEHQLIVDLLIGSQKFMEKWNLVNEQLILTIKLMGDYVMRDLICSGKTDA